MLFGGLWIPIHTTQADSCNSLRDKPPTHLSALVLARTSCPRFLNHQSTHTNLRHSQRCG